MDAQDSPTTFLKADEVDEGAGQDAPPRAETRPPLRRDILMPAPRQPPPPAPPQVNSDTGAPTDSLSLMQLRRLVTDMPKPESQPYDFVYADAASFQEEIEELFGYSVEERASLLKAKSTFVRRWEAFNDMTGYDEGKLDWTSAQSQTQTSFLQHLSDELSSRDTDTLESLEALLYLALGCWHETAGLDSLQNQDGDADEDGSSAYALSETQFLCLKDNLDKIGDTLDMMRLSSLLQAACVGTEADAGPHFSWACVTLMCLLVDHARRTSTVEVNRREGLRQCLLGLRPRPLLFLTNLLAEHRWNENDALPSPKILLCYWKLILLEFGGMKQVDEIKQLISEKPDLSANGNLGAPITASPLDYHLFRQEIISKYPAFNPPQPVFPFEANTNSILPPLQVQQGKDGPESRPTSSAGPSGINATGSSIIHEPVHIATPLPSPPPSPVGPGGKGIKKQNYQTNQMFPFLYPPLGEDSSFLGGKGNTELQDVLVGKRWEGSDIPTSILEAADLFAKRIRATRAMKQMWDTRVKFMKYERNYAKLDDDDTNSEGEPTRDRQDDDDMNRLNEDMRQRMDAVESFYVESLPRIQSTVIVLLKVLLQAVTTLVTSPYVPNGGQNGVHPSERGQDGLHDLNANSNSDSEEGVDTVLQELDVLRSQEIMGKAVSGILLLLLKWFRLSHVLKFECLTQLLLDSNYVQLVLKLFTHQELERVVTYKCERPSLNFFEFCRSHSRHTPDISSSDTGSSPSDAAPPPISLGRQPAEHDSAVISPDEEPGLPHPPPEVDELGQPVTDSPITDYSWRTFYTSINHLRILQKIVKAKPHRQLLMVQYKYSNILKKWLKVPQADIRLYTLKIIKGQVPYCHRKWRSSNMRVITAIYLHCRPELRDEWLAGVDVEAEMGESVAQEQALRALTYWFHLANYPAAMGEGQGAHAERNGASATVHAPKHGALRRDEQDWFLAELEKMDLAAGAGGESLAGDEGELLEAGEELLEGGVGSFGGGSAGVEGASEAQSQSQGQSPGQIQVHGEVVQAPPSDGQRERYGLWRGDV